MRAWLQFAVTAILICTLAALDAAFFPAFGSAARHMNVTLIAALYSMIILQERVAITVYVIATVLIGLTASTAIFMPITIGLFCLSVVNVLFTRFFTNRSYYTLIALGAAGWLLYYALFDSTRWLLKWTIFPDHYAPMFDLRWLISLLVGFIALHICLTVAYVMTVFVSKRFRSYFIVSDRL